MPSILHFVIRNRLGAGPSAIRKASAGALFARRAVKQHLAGTPEEQTILFIFGCQRSGTTMLSQIFEGDSRVSPFAEHSRKLARADHQYRLRDLESVREVFERSKGRLIVAKPLVESQRADEILDFFPAAKALWVYRDYKDVVRSYVKAFERAGINIMRKIMERGDSWASERVPDEAREVIEKFYSEDMLPANAAALFWWVRNGWFFDLELYKHPRVQVCHYGTLVSSPDELMRSLYKFVGIPYPGTHLVQGVHGRSRGLGNNIKLDPAIEALCHERLARLDDFACELRRQPVHV
jgi:hypothetical protein